MPRSDIEKFTVRRPDYIPEGEEHLHPAIGGVFHDFIPEGETALTLHGPTDDATPPAEAQAP